MSHELDIMPVKRDPTRPKYRECHENLLSPPFRISIIGSSRSGKSNYLMNYFRPSFYGGSAKSKVEPVFNRIYVFSPNLGLDSTTKAIKDLCDENDIYMSYNDGIIDNIIQRQKALGDNRDRVLIVADDLLALNASPTAKIFTSSTYLRHLDCSIIYITQIYRGHNSLPTVVRNNIEGLIWFKSPSTHQIKSLCEDLQGTFGSSENIQSLVDYATKEPYQFCFFNYRELEVYKNHTDLLYKKFNDDGSYAEDFKPP